MPVEIATSQINFAFPEVHDDARFIIYLHRTLRVPDDDKSYGLPPGLGGFDLQTVASVAPQHVPREWNPGEAVMPMWQSEACWMSFISPTGYPFLVKVGAGNINAITGGAWSERPDFVAEDYVEVPTQPWLDGFCVDDTTVRQFVAMPLGGGYTVEEQLSVDDSPAGGLRFAVYPMRGEFWDQRQTQVHAYECAMAEPPDEMGFGAGGSITQSIATPIEPHENWQLGSGETAFIRIVNSDAWQDLTGSPVPTAPLTIEEYTSHHYPWFEWYDDSLARQGAKPLAAVKTVKQIGDQKGEHPLPDNDSFTPPTPIVVGP